MNKLISVVVPVYNMGDSIERCLASIQKQSYQNIEIILVDDGSSDDSYLKCCSIAEKDDRVRVFHTENQGSGPARNVGILHSRGEYIYFPDADDYLDPDTISLCVEATENGKYDLVVFGFQTLTRSGKFLSEKKFKNCYKDGSKLRESYSDSYEYFGEYAIQGAPWNKFFSMEIIRNNKVEFPALRRHQDEAFISRYMCYSQNVHFIENVLYFYYENDLKNQWKKYPNNYVDIILGLYEIRQATVLQWNPADVKTYNLVQIEYLSKIVKAMELAYSPKMQLDSKGRRIYYEELIRKTNIMQMAIPDGMGQYQKKVCLSLKANKISQADLLVHCKVLAEKSGFMHLLRKIMHR